MEIRTVEKMLLLSYSRLSGRIPDEVIGNRWRRRQLRARHHEAAEARKISQMSTVSGTIRETPPSFGSLSRRTEMDEMSWRAVAADLSFQKQGRIQNGCRANPSKRILNPPKTPKKQQPVKRGPIKRSIALTAGNCCDFSRQTGIQILW